MTLDGVVTFLTDFADQAVVLPVVVVIAAALAAQGWRRGALAWLFAVGATFGTMLALKLVFLGCQVVFGPLSIHSPSGHTAAAALLGGGVAVLARARLAATAGAAVFAAVTIGTTRVLLGAHSPAEVMLGGTTGVAGVLLLWTLVGPRPAGLRIRWVLAAVVVVAALLHGTRMPAEVVIRRASAALAWIVPACASPLPDAPNSTTVPPP